MKNEDKKMMIDFLVIDSEYYKENVLRIWQSLNALQEYSDKLFFIADVFKLLLAALEKHELEKALNNKSDDPNSIDFDELALNKLIGYVGLLYVKYKRQLEFHEEMNEMEKKIQDNKSIENQISNLDLTDRLRKKIAKSLSDDELSELNKAINESISNTTIKTTVEEKTLLDKNEVARLFSVTTVTITDWMKKGILPYIRMNHRVYFTKSDIDRILATHAKRWRKQKD